jgi:hypothetical protein
VSIRHPERRRYSGRDIWRDAVPVALMALFVWAVLIGTPSQNDLKRVERIDRDTSRATAFRLCTRGKADRAYAHARERGIPIAGLPKPPPMKPPERRLRRMFSRLLMDPHLLPILDCAPNVEGHGARPLPISAPPKGCKAATAVGRCATQEAFVRAWAARTLDGVNLGVCPSSIIGGRAEPDRC